MALGSDAALNIAATGTVASDTKRSIISKALGLRSQFYNPLKDVTSSKSTSKDLRKESSTGAACAGAPAYSNSRWRIARDYSAALDIRSCS